MSSSFSKYSGRKKQCVCGHFVPNHVTPDMCFHCKREGSITKIMRTVTSVFFNQSAPKPAVFVLCAGICGRSVPVHVTPATCRHCANSKICDGPCKKIVNISTTVETCHNCDMILFPYTKCVGEDCINEVRKTDKCDSCVEIDRAKSYVEQMTDTYGAISSDYAIMLHIKGIGRHHTGYSCLTPFDIDDVDINHKICLPVCQSAIAEWKKVNGESDQAVSVKKFKNKHGEYSDVMNHYINSLFLKNIDFPGICGCGFTENPRVKNIAIVKKTKTTDLTDLYSLSFDNEPYRG